MRHRVDCMTVETTTSRWCRRSSVNWETFGGASDSVLPFYLPSLLGFPIVAWLVVEGKRPKPTTPSSTAGQ
jgi:hypothetical protein